MSDPSVEGPEVELSEQDPWPGLAAFAEESTHFFKGRECEADDVSRLIRREFLCVLFGKSGTGKSSLLRAGVFPRLRPSGFYPVYIRLRHEEFEPPLSEQVKHFIAETIRHAAGEIEAPEPGDQQTLWQYFHAADADWWDRKSHLVTPVLIFDQFEEILTVGRETEARTARANAFLSELEDLIEGRVPDDLQRRRDIDPAWRAEFDRVYNPAKRDLRIVLTLREDFLADLESLRERLKPVMLNRYRLLPMNGSQALQVVLEPAPGLVDEPVALQIIQRVSISDRSRLQTNPTREQICQRTVEPALLSVFCAELNRRRKALGLAKIDETMLEEAREEILSDFYERSFAGLPPPVRDFVEDKLLTLTGARDRCEISNALSYDSITEPVLGTLINRRLIRKEISGSSTWLEFTHDTIADVARVSKRSRQERARIEAAETELRLAREEAVKRDRQRKRALLVAAGCFLLCLVAVVLAIKLWSSNREIINRNREIIRVHGAMKQVEQKRDDLQEAVAELEKKRESLQKKNEELIEGSETKLGMYIAFANAALLDPYPRSRELLNRSDLQNVRDEFATIKDSLANSGSAAGRIDREFRVAAKDVIEAILRNDLDGAAQACDRAISANSTAENEVKARLLKLKGDILVHLVSVNWYSKPDLQRDGPSDPGAKELLEKLDRALAAYLAALEPTTGNRAQEAILLTRQARARIWRSRLESEPAGDLDQAAGLIQQAESRVANAPNQQQVNLSLARVEILRIRGFLSVRRGDDAAAAGFYEQSLAVANQVEASLQNQADPSQRSDRPALTTLLTEKLLAWTQLAACYERLIKKAAAGDPSIDLNDYKNRLADVLAKRIDLAETILKRYRSSRYIMQILGFSYYDQARCHFDYSLPGLTDHNADDKLRRGFLLTLSDDTSRGDDLRNYFEQVLDRETGNPGFGKAVIKEMRATVPFLQSLFQEDKKE
jgi:hypothetical protein